MVIRNVFLIPFASILGFLGGGFPTSLVIAWINYTASDGPIFPPPMIAFYVVAPISTVLFMVQMAAVFMKEKPIACWGIHCSW